MGAHHPKRARRRLRVVALAAAVTAALAGAGTAYVRVALHGEALAERVTVAINAQIRGHVEAESIEWPMSALPRAFIGRSIPLELRHVRVHDEFGDLVAKTDLARADLAPYPALGDRRDLIIDRLELPRGGYALIRPVPDPEARSGGVGRASPNTEISLVSAFQEPRRTGLEAGAGASEGPVVELRAFEVRGADLEFAFPRDLRDAFVAGEDGLDVAGAAREDGVYALAEDVHAAGELRADARDATRLTTEFSLAATVDRGTILTGGIPLVFRDLDDVRLEHAPDPGGGAPDLAMAATARTPGGARLRGDGVLRDYLDDPFGGAFDVEGEIRGAGPTARAMTRGAIGGSELGADVSLTGPPLAPVIALSGGGAEFDLDIGEAHEPVATVVPEAEISYEPMAGRGEVEEIVARARGGSITGRGSFSVGDRFRFWGGVEIDEPLELGDYIPPQVHPLLGETSASGTFDVSGEIALTGELREVVARDLDVRVGRGEAWGALRYTEDEHLEMGDLRARVGDTEFRGLGGHVDFARDALEDIRFSIDSPDFDDWLRRYGAEPVVETLRGRGRHHGPRTRPLLTAALAAGGVPIVGDVDFAFRHRGDRAAIDDARADLFGGEARASGHFALGSPLEIVSVDATAEDVELSELPVVGGLLEGRASAALSARGTVLEPEIELAISADSDLAVAGEAVPAFQLDAHLAPGGAGSIEARVAHERGAALDVRASADAGGALSGRLELEAFDLAAISELLFGDDRAGGTVSASARLSGDRAAPEVEGEVALGEVFFESAQLGAADLTVEPADEPGAAHVRGHFFEGMVAVAGTIETAPPFRADLSIRAHRAEIDRFLPDLAERTGGRAWVSGEVAVSGPLWPSAEERLSARGVVDEAVVLIDQSDVGGRPRPVRLESRAPVRLAVDGENVEIRDELVLAGDAGEFRVAGGGRPGELDVRMRGGLDVSLLEPYFRQQFDDIRGRAELDVELSGPRTDPRLSGTLNVADVAVRLAGQDAELRAPSGKIEIDNDQLAVTGLTLQALDPYSGEVAELTVGGGVGLRDYEPTLWGLHVHGALGGDLLLALFPEELSSARGTAELSLSLVGAGRAPDIDGEIRFGRRDPMALVPRGVRREIVLDEGRVRFTDDLVEFEGVGARVDDEGRVTGASGWLALDGGQPAEIDVTLSGEDLPFHIPQTLELLLGLRDLRIAGDRDRGLEISGDVDIIDGRYIQDFNPLLDEVRPRRVVEESPAFYQRIPILAGADLDLRVDARSFFVRNNVASVDMTGEIDVGGTPAAPQLDGVVRVEDGAFQFQGVRAEFEETTGTVTFERYLDFPEATPTLDVRTESEYRDFSGEDHLVVLELTGPLGQLQWDLFTTGGLNKAQTFMLIVSGRTPEEARRVIGDEPVVRDPGDFAGARSTHDPDGNLALVDQLVKDLAGDFFSLLIEDSIRNVTDLDVARLQLGTASVGFHGEKEFTRSFRVLGDVERSLRGWAWDVRGEYRLLDQFSVEGEYLHKDYDDDVEEDVRNFRVKAVYRWLFIP